MSSFMKHHRKMGTEYGIMGFLYLCIDIDTNLNTQEQMSTLN